MFTKMESPKTSFRLVISTLALVFVIGLFCSEAYAATFKDIDKSSSYARQAILKLADINIVSGDKGSFNPKDTVTRAQMAAFLVKGLGLDTARIPQNPTFNDVPKTHWAYKYVEAAYREGIIDGIAPGKFAPDQKCTREQMAKMFVNSLNNTAASQTPQNSFPSLDKFKDSYRISSWAKPYVAAAVQNGVMEGTSNATFSPELSATREQTAVVTDRFIKPDPANDTDTSPEIAIDAHQNAIVYNFASPVSNLSIHKITDSSGKEIQGDFLYLYGIKGSGGGITPLESDGPLVQAVPQDLMLEKGRTYNIVYSYITMDSVKKIIYTEKTVTLSDELYPSELLAYMSIPAGDNGGGLPADGNASSYDGNYANWGLAASDGVWTYFSDPVLNQSKVSGMDADGLFKMRPDGSGLAKISDDNAMYINFSDGWLYYRSQNDGGHIWKMKPDGSSRSRLNTDNSTNLLLSGQWIYYTNSSDNGRLYRIGKDGNGKVPLNNCNTPYAALEGDWIYYSNAADGYKLYKIKTDGSGNTKLGDDGAREVNVANGWVYYIQSPVNSDPAAGYRLYKIKTDGTGRTQLNNYRTGTLNVSGGWIYYTLFDTLMNKFGVYRMKPDGTGSVKLLNKNSDINISSGWLYFENGRDSYWRMRTDGSEPQWIGIGKEGTAPDPVTPDYLPLPGAAFTLGSAEDELNILMGYGSVYGGVIYDGNINSEPNLVHVLSYPDGSTVTIIKINSKNVVGGWNNKGSLKVDMGKADLDAAPFTLGSDMYSVVKAMGTPDYLESGVWRYNGKGEIRFDENSNVKGWDSINSGLKVTLAEKVQDAPNFGLGSTKADVLAAMGTPSKVGTYYLNSAINGEYGFGDSYVVFDSDGRIIKIYNIGNNLHIDGPRDPDAPPVTIGSTEDDVLNAMGPPHFIDRNSFWDYEDSFIQFDQNGLVSYINNTDGNIKVSNAGFDPKAPPFTRGSTMEDVARAAGVPETIYTYKDLLGNIYTQWRAYGNNGDYNVYFNRENKVAYWFAGSYGSTAWTPDPNLPPVNVGSDKDAVADTLGQPQNWKYESAIWYYGSSAIHFDSKGRVCSWENYDNLKIGISRDSNPAAKIYPGSDLETVESVLGAPAILKVDLNNNYTYDAVYGSSHVYFDVNCKVIGWYDGGDLRQSLPESTGESIPIRLGTAQSDVLKSLGAPDSAYPKDRFERSDATWNYGDSNIRFDTNGLVIGWDNMGNLKLEPDSSEPGAPLIKQGSTEDDVEKAMGTPDGVGGITDHKFVYGLAGSVNRDYAVVTKIIFRYGDSYIGFDYNDNVCAWMDTGNLSIERVQPDQSAANITVGSSKQDVINAMGTPDNLYGDVFYYGQYFEIWTYGTSYIEFDSNGRVKAWKNDGGLKVAA